jgi:hypothetical protein
MRFSIYGAGGSYFKWSNNGSEQMRITSGGNVGIGTTSPDSRLHLGTNVNQSIKVNSANANATYLGIFNDAAALAVNRDPATGNIQDATKATSAVYVRGEASNGYITFETTATNNVNSTERMRITSGGNVGIGTTSPEQRLHVVGNGLFSGTGRTLQIVSSNDAVPAVIRSGLGAISTLSFQGTTSTNDFNVRIGAEANDLIAFTNNEIRLRITSTGAGTFSSSVTANGNAATTPSFIANNGSGAGGTAQHYIDFTAGATVISRMSRGNGASGLVANGLNIDNFDGFGIRLNQLGGSGGNFIIQGGNVGIGTTSPSERLTVSGNVLATAFFASSDIRLKNIIKTNYNPTGIEAISYKWKDSGIDTKMHIGYSAQQVQEFMPDAVSKDSNGKLSVNYVEVLVAKIAALEAKVKQLEAK